MTLRYPWADPDIASYEVELVDVEAGGIWWRSDPGATFTPWQWIVEMRYPSEQDPPGDAG